MIIRNLQSISNSGFLERTTKQQEIDLIEESRDKLTAFEFKWSKNEKPRFLETFTANYPGATTQIISPENVEVFLVEHESNSLIHQTLEN